MKAHADATPRRATAKRFWGATVVYIIVCQYLLQAKISSWWRHKLMQRPHLHQQNVLEVSLSYIALQSDNTRCKLKLSEEEGISWCNAQTCNSTTLLRYHCVMQCHTVSHCITQTASTRCQILNLFRTKAHADVASSPATTETFWLDITHLPV